MIINIDTGNNQIHMTIQHWYQTPRCYFPPEMCQSTGTRLIVLVRVQLSTAPETPPTSKLQWCNLPKIAADPLSFGQHLLFFGHPILTCACYSSLKVLSSCLSQKALCTQLTGNDKLQISCMVVSCIYVDHQGSHK